MRLLAAVMIVAALAACAPTTRMPQIDAAKAAAEAELQREAAVREDLLLRDRLNHVAWRVSLANADLCGTDVAPYLGLNLTVLAQANRDFRPAWSKLGIKDRLTVSSVASGSPAASAGLMPGDELVSVEGVDVPEGAAGMGVLREKTEAAAGGPITMIIQRGGQQHPIELSSKVTCRYPVEMKHDNRVNAWADGTRITVTTGMLRFVENDDELALVVGHELAHNTMGHLDKTRGNRLVGSIIGATIQVLLGVPGVGQAGANAGQMAYSQEFEGEADYVGVYHAARAGYDVKGAASLWRRMAVAHPNAIGLQGSSHPSTAKRYLAVEAAAAEVAVKVGKGGELKPNMDAAIPQAAGAGS